LLVLIAASLVFISFVMSVIVRKHNDTNLITAAGILSGICSFIFYGALLSYCCDAWPISLGQSDYESLKQRQSLMNEDGIRLSMDDNEANSNPMVSDQTRSTKEEQSTKSVELTAMKSAVPSINTTMTATATATATATESEDLNTNNKDETSLSSNNGNLTPNGSPVREAKEAEEGSHAEPKKSPKSYLSKLTSIGKRKNKPKKSNGSNVADYTSDDVIFSPLNANADDDDDEEREAAVTVAVTGQR
jgi:hypothetical protein